MSRNVIKHIELRGKITEIKGNMRSRRKELVKCYVKLKYNRFRIKGEE
jgi:hypothetical protein